jgi:hypothetical protein
MKMQREDHKMDKRSIFERGFAILLSVILMAACFPLSIFAEDTTQDPDFSGTNLMNLENVQPSGYTTTTNPYGYDIGEPFLMVEQNELMYLNAWDNRVRQASYFSMGSESALNTFATNKSGSSGTFSNPNYKLMQAVSFDPTGSGRRDHVAFVGVGQDKKGYMWVIDTTKGTGSDRSGLVEIGDFSYMFDESAFKVPTYSNRSFLNIVAGDFDGDVKESIVVYTPESYNAGGCQIQQWDYDGDSLSRRGKSNSLLMGYYNDHPWYDVERSEGNQRRKLGVSMAVGDFNGDCVDDLAVLSYCHRLPNDEAQIDYYRPVVKIVYGTKGDTGSSIVTKSAAQSEEFYTSKGRSGGRDRYEFPVGASLTCGDFDGDGDVDLFLAGMLGKLGTWKKNNQQVNETIDMNAGYLYIGKLSNSGNGFVKTTNQTIESNGWTDGGYHDADDVWQQLAVESVAINGKGRGAKELVFLSGTLYDASNNKPVAVYTGDYFKSADDGASSTTRISNCDIQSIAVGNFDGNKAGREQVVFTIALKHKNNNESHLLTGYMRGINYVYSKDESGAYTRVSGKLSAEATEYEIKDLDLKGKYTYVVTTVATVDNKDYESVWSNEAHYRADEAPYIGSNGNWWVGGTDTGVKAAGDDGKPGKDGETPYIGENGNWWIGFTDTKVKAAGTDGKDGEKGEDGETPYIGENGNWWIGETDTGVKAVGTDGADGTNGTDGLTPSIGENGNWWIGTTDTGVKAAGTDGTNGTNGADGLTPSIGENGNWWIGTTDTGVKAAGTDGTNGTNGADGLTPSIGENGNWWIGETDTGVKAAGTDGTNGTNGADGLTPSIGENGNWWIGATDTGVKAAATDGADGKDGADGTNGVDGRTPQLKIGDDNLWYVSYDNGQNWESLNVKATGEMGATGAQGEKGDKGDQGEQGIQGVQGEKGDKGDQGEQGIQGVQGEKGDKGDQGEQGIQGVQGEKGDKGDQGEQGIQGVQGEKGDAGADGASGQNGTNGINGKNGVNGQDGQNGQDGKDGQDGTAGRGIDNAMIDNDGYLILTMTDGTTINAGLVRDTSAVANKEANDSATAKSLATAAVGLSGASLLWNIAMLALSITMKRKYTTFHR